jgi:hypothetical protein
MLRLQSHPDDRRGEESPYFWMRRDVLVSEARTDAAIGKISG